MVYPVLVLEDLKLNILQDLTTTGIHGQFHNWNYSNRIVLLEKMYWVMGMFEAEHILSIFLTFGQNRASYSYKSYSYKKKFVYNVWT